MKYSERFASMLKTPTTVELVDKPILTDLDDESMKSALSVMFAGELQYLYLEFHQLKLISNSPYFMSLRNPPGGR